MKTNGLFVGIALTILLMGPICSEAADAAASGTVDVADVAAHPGDTVDIAIDLRGNPGLWALGFDVSYPSGMSIARVTPGAMLQVTEGNLAANPYRVYGESAGLDDCIGDGTVVTIAFNVSEGMAAGDYEIALSGLDSVNVDGGKVLLELGAGAVKVTAASEPEASEPAAWDGFDIDVHLIAIAVGIVVLFIIASLVIRHIT